MKNHSDEMYADSSAWNIYPQIPHKLFGPSAIIGQSFGMFLKKALITCPLSIFLAIHIVKESPFSAYYGRKGRVTKVVADHGFEFSGV